MALNADNPGFPEFIPQKPIQVDLNLSVSQLFPNLPEAFNTSAESLQQTLTGKLRNIVAVTNVENGNWHLAFRSPDTKIREVIDIAEDYHLHSFLVDLNLQEAHKILFLQRNDKGKRSLKLVYDNVLNSPREFQANSDEMVQYVSHMREMVADDGVLVVQLEDKPGSDHNQQVMDALQMRFGTPVVTRLYEIYGQNRGGKLLVYKGGPDVFAIPDFTTDTSNELPSEADAVDIATEFLRTRRLAEV